MKSFNFIQIGLTRGLFFDRLLTNLLDNEHARCVHIRSITIVLNHERDNDPSHPQNSINVTGGNITTIANLQPCPLFSYSFKINAFKIGHLMWLYFSFGHQSIMQPGQVLSRNRPFH